ncbi:MAG: DUF6259 domain-containing protein [Propionibacteriaceae bacterium]|jgi:hypothetical protein|nr:DUF6259 domain-containing protein [Propionibacteriaceae bacterium]
MTGTQEFRLGATRLRLASGTLALANLAVDGEAWFGAGSLWRLLVADEVGHRVTLDAGHAAHADSEPHADGIRLTWSDVADPATGAGPFDVQVWVRPLPDGPGATGWRIGVANRSGWTLWSVTFPSFEGLVPAGDGSADRLFFPEGWGTELVGWDAMADLDRRYPRGWDFALQLLGYTRGASVFSLATLDPAMTTKDFSFRRVTRGAGPAGPDRSAAVAVTCYPENMSLPGNSYTPDFEAAVRVQPGDWYDAATAYAAWARRQPWAAAPETPEPRVTPETPAVPATPETPAVPQVEAGVQAWQVLNVPARDLDEWGDRVERLATRLGVRLGVHFYDWHETPFDTNYPDYFPARPGFAGLVARLRAAGVLTMPYINGRLWDVSAPSWASAGAERWAAKWAAERLRPRTLYPYLEEYGSGQKLAPMCPVTEAWQTVIVRLCDRIVHELGCDGVYLDQVTAEKAELCFDPGHGHPLGGGGFWWEGYRALLGRVRAELPGAYVTSECTWEGGVAAFDGLLTWHSLPGNLVPLFAAVYSGLAHPFGCRFEEADLDEAGGHRFAARMAQLFCWGAELGWGDLTRLLDSPERAPLLDFFAELCQARARHAALFRRGRLLRPPTVTGAAADAGVTASLWRDDRGGTTLFLVNPAVTPQRVTVAADQAALSVTLLPLSHQAVTLSDPGPTTNPAAYPKESRL